MSDDETQSEKFTVDQICENIEGAAEDAIKTKDYISYATVLEINLSDPSQWSEEERVNILKQLYSVLLANDVLVQEIGWDIPAMLLDFLDSDYGNNSVLETPCVREVMDIFSLLSTKGNAKEVYLKSIEALTSLQSDEGPSSYTYPEFAFDVKFYAVFHLMDFSLQRIDTQYPSRFLATSTSALLSFLATNMESMSANALAIVLRRLFTFARDFHTAAESISEKEASLCQSFLQSYVTWVTDLAFQRFSMRWSQRLYIELKARCEGEPEVVRKSKYQQHRDLDDMTGCIYCLTQLAYSFDIDLNSEFTKFVNEGKTESGAEEGTEREELFKGLSEDGLLLLYTQCQFDDRSIDNGITFAQLVKLGERFLNRDDGAVAPYGVLDALIFWSLWTSRTATPQDIAKVPKDEFYKYLQQLSIISASSSMLAEQRDVMLMVNSLIAKFLAMSEEDVAFEFIMDTFQHCPFESVRDSSVHMLKNFAIRRRQVSQNLSADVAKLSLQDKPNDDGDQDSPSSRNCPIIHLKKDGGRVKQIKDVILSDIEQVKQDTGEDHAVYTEKYPVVLSWLNFLMVVETSQAFIKAVVANCEHMQEKTTKEQEGDDTVRGRLDLMKMAIERLRKRWLD